MPTDVEMEIYNQTDRNLRFVLLQQDPTIEKMFKDIFPVAWRVLYLSGGSKAKLKYPAAMQIGVKEKNVARRVVKEGRGLAKLPAVPPLERQRPPDLRYERFTITKDTVKGGQSWKFSLEKSFPTFTLLSEGPGKIITCRNEVNENVDIYLCKEGLPFLARLDVMKYDAAGLGTSPKIGVMYSESESLVQGAILRAPYSAPVYTEIDLSGISKVIVRLKGTGESLEWKMKKE